MTRRRRKRRRVEYTTRDHLLALLGVFPDTSTLDSDGSQDGGVRFELAGTITVFLALTTLAYWTLARRRRDA